MHYFHRTCGVILDKMDEAARLCTLANVDYICTETVWSKHRKKLPIRKELLAASAKYYYQVMDFGEKQTPRIPMAAPRDVWIVFPERKDAEAAVAAAGGGASKKRKLMTPQVLLYDEGLGVALTEQECVLVAGGKSHNWVKLPWRE